MNTERLKELAEDIVDYTVEKGADDAVVNAFTTDTRQIRFSENQIDIFNRWNETYFNLFLARKGCVVSTSIKGSENYIDVVDGAVRTAEISTPSEDYLGIAGKTAAKSRRTVWKPPPDEKLSDFVHRAVNTSLENGALKSAGTLYNEQADHYLCSSAGIKRFENGSSLYLSIRCFVDDEASGHSVVSSLNERNFRPEKAAEKAATLARLVGKPQTGTEGKYDAVLDPMIVATITSEVGSMSSSFSVMSGFSCFAGRIGKKVASPQVTIEDDGTRQVHGRRSFDDEGVAVRKTKIISKGVLKTFLHNTSTAKKFRTKTTGNAGLIEPEAFSISMEGGKESKDALMEEVRDGLYINNVWYTRYQNRKVGSFSTIPRDAILRIRKGEIAGSVKNVRITENLLKLLQKIDAVSKEREHIYWWLESYTPSTVPYALVRKLNITRSADM